MSPDRAREQHLLIGLQSTNYPTDRFFSVTNLYEYEVILWALAGVANEIRGGLTPTQRTQMGERIDKLREWIEKGHALVVLLSNVDDALLNSAAIKLDQLFAPFGPMTFRNMAGEKVEFCGPAHVRDVLQPWLPRMGYELIVEGAITPLLRVEQRRGLVPQLVGGIRKMGDGLLILVPPLRNISSVDEATAFLEALLQLPKRLSRVPTELPAWAQRFRTEGEDTATTQAATLRRRIAEIQEQIDDQQKIISDGELLKRLFTASGDDFHEAVAEALRELGLTVANGPHPRADLLASDGRRIGVLEVKGLEAAAREINLRQTQSWVADVLQALAASLKREWRMQS